MVVRCLASVDLKKSKTYGTSYQGEGPSTLREAACQHVPETNLKKFTAEVLILILLKD